MREEELKPGTTTSEDIEAPVEHNDLPPAHSLREAADSDGTLQGYVAMNYVNPSNEIAEVAANEKPLDHEAIARRAYQYWEERGGAHGSHEDDWHRAERELRSGSK